MSDLDSTARVRFKLLDGLRLVAALSVVMYHYLGYEHSRWGMPATEQFPILAKFAAYGGLGVHLFFIISGFVILMSAWGRTLPQFVASRISRLFPAYWVSVLASVVLFVVITRNTIKDLTPIQVLVNLTMTQSGFGVDRVDGVYWTLWVELMFYVLIGVLISRNPTRGKLMAFIFLWPIVAAAAQHSDAGFIAYFLAPQYAPMFAGGMALYLVYKFGHSLVNWLLVAFNAVVGAQQASAGFFSKSMIPDTEQDLSINVCVAIIILMFVVVAVLTLTPIRGRGPAWLTYAGALTYPVYLMHENWGWWIISWANPQFGKWVALLLALAFTFISAALIERYVERTTRSKLSRAILRGFEDHPLDKPLKAGI